MNSPKLLMFLAAAALAGCTTTEPDEEAVVKKAQEVTPIHIHSLPPGCFVELNNEFMGVTPVTIRVPSSEGKWTGSMYQLNRLRVSMPRGGGYEEKRWYGYDPIPQRVVFRIRGAEHYYHANRPKRPEKPTVQVQ
jgi:hypothetical protein